MKSRKTRDLTRLTAVHIYGIQEIISTIMYAVAVMKGHAGRLEQ